MSKEYIEIREEKIPLKKYESFKKVRIIGGTGAGKSQFMRHLLGTNENKFPAVATGKCTVAKVEVITYEQNYSTIITFYKKKFLECKVEELLSILCNKIFDKKYDERECTVDEYLEKNIYREFRYISNQTFKLNFLLEFEDVKEILEGIFKIVNDNCKNTELIEDEIKTECKKEVTVFKKAILTKILLKIELILENFQQDLIKKGLEDRCEYIKEDGYTEAIYIDNIEDKKAFFEIIKVFFDNNIRNKGKILNTVVEGIRICGNFMPDWYKGSKPYKFIFIDGIGLGHNPDEDKKIKEEMTEVDSIVYLKDCKPQYEYEKEFVELCTASSWTNKVLFAFSHFDSLLENEEFLPSDFEGRKQHVVDNFIEHIEDKLLKNSVDNIENSDYTIEEKQLQIESEKKRYGLFEKQLNNYSFAFTLKCDDIKTSVIEESDEEYNIDDEIKYCNKESNILLELLQNEGNTYEVVNKTILNYDEKNFIKGIFMGIKKYNSFWSNKSNADGRSTWRIIESLCYKYGYEKDTYCSWDLASELSQGIIFGINAMLDSPKIESGDFESIITSTELLTQNIEKNVRKLIYNKFYNKIKCKITWQDAYNLKDRKNNETKTKCRIRYIDEINNDATDVLCRVIKNPERNINVDIFIKENKLVNDILKEIRYGIKILTLKCDNLDINIKQFI